MCGACAMGTSEVDAKGSRHGSRSRLEAGMGAPAPEPVPLSPNINTGPAEAGRRAHACGRATRTARSSARARRLEPARAIERDEVVETPDVFPVDEDLRDGTAHVRALEHLLAPLRVEVDADLGVFLPLAGQVALRGDA